MRLRSAALFPRTLLLVALVAAASAPAARALEPVNRTLLGGLALDGYDAVAYFTDAKPVEGKKEFSTEWNGATWRFASAEHRDEFVKTPEKYAPQYGGYCAWAVAHNYTADADPEAWSIVDGKLYLNYDKKIMAKWKEDVPGHVAKGDANWPKLLTAK